MLPPSDQYPVTAVVCKQLHDAIGLKAMREFPIGQMIEALQGYEHGNADTKDLLETDIEGRRGRSLGVTLPQYAAVLVDLALTIHCSK